MSLPLPPPFEGGSNKSSMGATSCSSLLHFEAFYLEMNRRPLHNEGGEENILLKAEDVVGWGRGDAPLLIDTWCEIVQLDQFTR